MFNYLVHYFRHDIQPDWIPQPGFSISVVESRVLLSSVGLLADRYSLRTPLSDIICETNATANPAMVLLKFYPQTEKNHFGLIIGGQANLQQIQVVTESEGVSNWPFSYFTSVWIEEETYAIYPRHSQKV